MFDLGTALITGIATTVASVVLMLPNPVEFAIRLDIKAFPFALAVSFAIRTPLATPVEDQPELLVSGPASYNVIDFTRDGAPP